MNNLGEAQHLLGISLKCFSDNSVFLSQEHYVEKILAEHNMLNCRVVNTPMVPDSTLANASEDDHSTFLKLNVNYRKVLGSLNYLSMSSMPDIAFTISQLSQHLAKPGMSHWRAVIHLLLYLSGTRHYGIMLRSKRDLRAVEIFTDVDFANCVDDSHSYSGMLSLLGGNVIS